MFFTSNSVRIWIPFCQSYNQQPPSRRPETVVATRGQKQSQDAIKNSQHAFELPPWDKKKMRTEGSLSLSLFHPRADRLQIRVTASEVSADALAKGYTLSTVRPSYRRWRRAPMTLLSRFLWWAASARYIYTDVLVMREEWENRREIVLQSCLPFWLDVYIII